MCASVVSSVLQKLIKAAKTLTNAILVLANTISKYGQGLYINPSARYGPSQVVKVEKGYDYIIPSLYIFKLECITDTKTVSIPAYYCLSLIQWVLCKVIFKAFALKGVL